MKQCLTQDSSERLPCPPLSSATGQHVTITGSACQSLIWSIVGGWIDRQVLGLGLRVVGYQLWKAVFDQTLRRCQIQVGIRLNHRS